MLFFLPHHAVFKETSTTKITGVVLDGSAKISIGLSINDVLQLGPTLNGICITLYCGSEPIKCASQLT